MGACISLFTIQFLPQNPIKTIPCPAWGLALYGKGDVVEEEQNYCTYEDCPNPPCTVIEKQHQELHISGHGQVAPYFASQFQEKYWPNQTTNFLERRYPFQDQLKPE